MTARINTIVEVVERGRQGERGERGIDGSVSQWSATALYQDLNQKVEYKSNIYNLHNPPAPIALPPDFNNNFWRPITGGVGNFTPNLTDIQDGEILIWDEEGNTWVNSKIPASTVEYDKDVIEEPVAREGTVGRSTMTNRLHQQTNVKGFLDETVKMNSGRFIRNVVSAIDYNPFTMDGWSDYVYDELGTGTANTDKGSNVTGSYHLSLTRTEFPNLQVGDCIYVTTAPFDELDVPDLDNVYLIQRFDGVAEFVLTRPLKIDIAEGTVCYKLTATFDEVENDVTDIRHYGWVGYPFTLKYANSSDIVVYDGTNWTWESWGETDVRYGVGFWNYKVNNREVNLWSKSASEVVDNEITLRRRLELYVRGVRYEVDPLTIELRTHNIQNVYVCPNDVDYDLADYPDSYVLRNYQGTGLDYVVLFGVTGTNPKFSKEMNQMVDMCHVEMDASGIIHSVNDTIWVYSNGTNETKHSTRPKVIRGYDVIENGLVDANGNTKYTLTNSKVVSSYLEIIQYDFPEDLEVTEVYGDTTRRITGLVKDGRYHDTTQTGGAARATIPLNSYGVDLLYAYENPNAYRDLLLVKGNRTYTEDELAIGINPNVIDLNGYFLVAMLIQRGDDSTEFERIISVKGSHVQTPVRILTANWLNTISQKAQTRVTAYGTTDHGYNVYTGDPSNGFETGDVTSQGWTIPVMSGTDSLNVSVEDEALKFRTASLLDVNQITLTKDISQSIGKLLINGGVFTTTINSSEGTTTGGFRWDGDNQLGAPYYYKFPAGGTTNYAKVIGENVPTLREGGELYLEVITPSAANTLMAITGIDELTDGGILRRNSSFWGMYSPGVGIFSFTGSGSTPRAGLNTILITRGVGNAMTVVVNGGGAHNLTFGADLPIGMLGRMKAGSQVGSADVVIQKMTLRETADSAVREWRMNTQTDTIEEIVADGEVAVNYLIQNYGEENWTKFGTPGAYEYSISNPTATETSFTFTLPDGTPVSLTVPEVGYFRMTVMLKESPDGVTLGKMFSRLETPSGTVLVPEEFQNVDAIITEGNGENQLYVGSNRALLRDTLVEINPDITLIELIGQDFNLNNSFIINGDRDLTIQVPPFSDELQSSSTVSFRFTRNFAQSRVTVIRQDATTTTINKGKQVEFTLPEGTSEVNLRCILSETKVNYEVTN